MLLRRSFTVPLFAAIAALLMSLMVAPPAEAAPRKPATVKKIKHTSTLNSVTITWAKAKHAKRYRVCLIRKKGTEKCHRRSKASKKRQVTFRGLKPAKGTDFTYRVYAYNGKRSSKSKKRKINLRPDRARTPRMVVENGHAARLEWSKTKNANKWTVQVATDRSFTTDVAELTTRKQARVMNGLNGGMTYWARVRAFNDKQATSWGPAITFSVTNKPLTTSVKTYNTCGEDKCRSSAKAKGFGKNILTWSKGGRKKLAGRESRWSTPDVIALQETPLKAKFDSALKDYTRGHYRSAKSIYYRKGALSSLRGGAITLDSARNRFATWELLRSPATGTTFYVVNAHLEPQKGKKRDDIRAAQMRVLTNAVNRLNTHRLPVVYAGDWNSNSSNANQENYPGGYDAPADHLKSMGYVNALSLAQTTMNPEVNSANQADTRIRRNKHQVDAIFVQNGTLVSDWRQLVRSIQPSTTKPYGQPADPQYLVPHASDHNPVMATVVVGGS